jgi:protein involved in polysaccharide export with SLBB domain
MARRVALVAAVVVLAGLLTARADAALHPGDKVDVTVFNHPELSGTRTLDAFGNISLPVAGTIPALDAEPSDVAYRVQQRLAAYVRHVAVNVQLDAQSESIFVTGGTNGVLPYAPGESLAAAVTQLQTGSATPAPDSANTQAVTLHDLQQNQPLDLVNGPVDFHVVRILREHRVLGPYDVIALRSTGQTGPQLAPDDTLELQNKPVAVTVTGDVEKPGIAYLMPDEPLAQALNQVGGVALTSTETNLTLDRDGVAMPLTLGAPAFSEPAHNNDRIIVPRAPRVDVLGSVLKPGDTVLRGNTTLLAALFYAGGPTQYANLKSVQVMRNGVRTDYNLHRLQKGQEDRNPVLQDGDVVYVPQGSTFTTKDFFSSIGALGIFGIFIH